MHAYSPRQEAASVQRQAHSCTAGCGEQTQAVMMTTLLEFSLAALVFLTIFIPAIQEERYFGDLPVSSR